MEDIARMADECMRDVDNDEDDSSLEDDEDLLVGVDSFHCIGLRTGTLSAFKYRRMSKHQGKNKLLCNDELLMFLSRLIQSSCGLRTFKFLAAS